MKFFVYVVFIGIALYGFFLWKGSNIDIRSDRSSSGTIATSKSTVSTLGARTTDFSEKLALGASTVAGALAHSVQLSLEEIVWGQLIDQVLRLYDQLGTEEKKRVKESVCAGP